VQKALEMFQPYRFTRKVSIFGSARTNPDTPEYKQAKEFARLVTDTGFMVLTGGGGGIMAAGNEGAGKGRSFGLNIHLPFEQSPNEYLSDRLVNFKYFFTRKLFFLRESDAIALFPGGFGTQDELFECLTLLQTGKTTPMPLILIEPPGSTYWEEWDSYIREHLLDKGLISPEDQNLYCITNSIEDACAKISEFYSIYHSSRWIEDTFVVRLNFEISDNHLDRLNLSFADILVRGQIRRSQALEAEKWDTHLADLPRLVMDLDHQSYGHIQKLIWEINQS
jgi:uncharacterized protein (TIGR00730 family)